MRFDTLNLSTLWKVYINNTERFYKEPALSRNGIIMYVNPP